MSTQIRIFKNWNEEGTNHYEKPFHPTSMVSNRHGCNLKILESLTKFLMENPNIRFGQALWILGILDGNKDSFCEEPESVLRRIDVSKI